MFIYCYISLYFSDTIKVVTILYIAKESVTLAQNLFDTTVNLPENYGFNFQKENPFQDKSSTP